MAFSLSIGKRLRGIPLTLCTALDPKKMRNKIYRLLLSPDVYVYYARLLVLYDCLQ